jgi:hypothetical protein
MHPAQCASRHVIRTSAPTNKRAGQVATRSLVFMKILAATAATVHAIHCGRHHIPQRCATQHEALAVKAASAGVLKALASRSMCHPPGSAPSFALLSGAASHSACRHAAAAATAAALLWLAVQLRSDCNSPAAAASAASTSCCRQHSNRQDELPSPNMAHARVQQRMQKQVWLPALPGLHAVRCHMQAMTGTLI